MTQSFVKDCFKSYQSFYSAVTLDSVIYFKLLSWVIIYLWINIIWKKRQFLSDLSHLNETDNAATFWDIKNFDQLSRWVEADLNQFLEVLNKLQT